MSFNIKTRLRNLIGHLSFKGSPGYWEDRYKSGGTSGEGSYGRLAEFKAQTISEFLKKSSVQTVLELGCGDGNQLGLIPYPNYTGIDISPSAVDRCREQYKADPSKAFYTLGDFPGGTFDLCLSLDVLYHLVEEEIFKQHLALLFTSAEQYVCIYSSNTDVNHAVSPHVRHRKFTAFVEKSFPEWKLIQETKNPYPSTKNDSGEKSDADFFFFSRASA